MLIEFSVKNFLSFKENVCLSMEKATGDQKPENLFAINEIELINIGFFQRSIILIDPVKPCVSLNTSFVSDRKKCICNAIGHRTAQSNNKNIL